MIFGATGDLARRKLLPSLYRAVSEGGIRDRAYVLGIAPGNLDDDSFRLMSREALAGAGHTGTDAARWCDERVLFEKVPRDAESLTDLARRIESIEADNDLPGNRAFYLALPPPAVPAVVEFLGAAHLNRSAGWTRLVVEKPFGRDLDSARSLNDSLHKYFDEGQIFRIDHYLGKETVQNLLTFRFANPLFESTWNRDRLASIEITVAESIGVGTRAGYYETSGVIRDMIQNHMAQLLTLVSMEAPSRFTADAIRNEKVQVLESVKPISPADVVLGQYTAGTISGRDAAGYREEPGVATDSATPTYVAMKVAIESWRWQGVPIFLRTGKRLPRRTTQIAVTYRPAPVCILHGVGDDCPINPNVIVLTLQPDEGFSVRFELKAPGEPVTVTSEELSFDYHSEFSDIPDAYQTLIADIMVGDQTLFVRGDEVEASWRLFAPLLDAELEVHSYAAGTWGPAATEDRLGLGAGDWTMRD